MKGNQSKRKNKKKKGMSQAMLTISRSVLYKHIKYMCQRAANHKSGQEFFLKSPSHEKCSYR